MSLSFNVLDFFLRLDHADGPIISLIPPSQIMHFIHRLTWEVSFDSKLSFSFISIAGLEMYNTDKSKCQDHFDIYKECKKKEVHNSCQRLYLLFFFDNFVSNWFFFVSPNMLCVFSLQREARLERNKNRSLFSWKSWLVGR